jgi:TonB family protein
MMAKKRRKIKRKTKAPWGMPRTITVSLLAHVLLIATWIAVDHLGTSDHAGSKAITIHEVMLGDGETGGAHSTSDHRDALASSSIKTTAKQESAIRESTTESGNGTGSTTGNGAGSGEGSAGNRGAGNPVLSEIRRRIESAKRYPAQARAMHQEGRVGLRFHIHPNGQIADVQITQSSGVPTLDDAAIQAVSRSAPLPYYAGAIAFPLNFHLK